MYTSKDYKDRQAKFFKAQRALPGSHFDEFVTDYIEWKIKNLYQSFKVVTEKTSDSEAKAYTTRVSGGLDSLESILKRIKN